MSIKSLISWIIVFIIDYLIETVKAVFFVNFGTSVYYFFNSYRFINSKLMNKMHIILPKFLINRIDRIQWFYLCFQTAKIKHYMLGSLNIWYDQRLNLYTLLSFRSGEIVCSKNNSLNNDLNIFWKDYFEYSIIGSVLNVI